MPKPRPRPEIMPRVVGRMQLAVYLNRSESWLAVHLLEMEARGFPSALPIVGGYDLRAVDAWLDQIGGAIPELEGHAADAWMRAAHG